MVPEAARYPGAVDADAHRAEAIASSIRARDLLGSVSRSADQDAELLTAAFASRHHWQVVGGLQEWIVSDWLVSRAAAAVGVAHLALLFAERAYSTALRDGTPAWAQASAAEGVARAYGAAADLDQRDAWCAIARDLVEAIDDQGDRVVAAGQLADTAAFAGPTGP